MEKTRRRRSCCPEEEDTTGEACRLAGVFLRSVEVFELVETVRTGIQRPGSILGENFYHDKAVAEHMSVGDWTDLVHRYNSLKRKPRKVALDKTKRMQRVKAMAKISLLTNPKKKKLSLTPPQPVAAAAEAEKIKTVTISAPPPPPQSVALLPEDDDLDRLDDAGRMLCLETECRRRGLPVIRAVRRLTGEILDLSKSQLSDPYIDLFATMWPKPLTKVDLSENRLTAAGVKLVVATLPKEVRSLSISGNPAAGLLTMSRDLDELRAADTGFTNEGALTLVESLVTYRMNRGCLSLTTLDLGRNSLGEEACAALAYLLHPHIASLRRLNLSWNNVTSAAAVHVLTPLTRNQEHASKLVTLDLSFNNIGGGECYRLNSRNFDRRDSKNALLIGEDTSSKKKTMKKPPSSKKDPETPSTTTPTTTTTTLQVTAVDVLCEIFRKNVTLRHLSLSANNFNRKSVHELGKAMEQNKTLLGLHFEDKHARVDSRGHIKVAKQDIFIPGGVRKSPCTTCWLCGRWVTVRLEVRAHSIVKGVQVHLELDDWQPTMLRCENTGMIRVWSVSCALPPGKSLRYFYTVAVTPPVYNTARVHRGPGGNYLEVPVEVAGIGDDVLRGAIEEANRRTLEVSNLTPEEADRLFLTDENWMAWQRRSHRNSLTRSNAFAQKESNAFAQKPTPPPERKKSRASRTSFMDTPKNKKKRISRASRTSMTSRPVSRTSMTKMPEMMKMPDTFETLVVPDSSSNPPCCKMTYGVVQLDETADERASQFAQVVPRAKHRDDDVFLIEESCFGDRQKEQGSYVDTEKRLNLCFTSDWQLIVPKLRSIWCFRKKQSDAMTKARDAVNSGYRTIRAAFRVYGTVDARLCRDAYFQLWHDTGLALSVADLDSIFTQATTPMEGAPSPHLTRSGLCECVVRLSVLAFYENQMTPSPASAVDLLLRDYVNPLLTKTVPEPDSFRHRLLYTAATDRVFTPHVDELRRTFNALKPTGGLSVATWRKLFSGAVPWHNVVTPEKQLETPKLDLAFRLSKLTQIEHRPGMFFFYDFLEGLWRIACLLDRTQPDRALNQIVVGLRAGLSSGAGSRRQIGGDSQDSAVPDDDQVLEEPIRRIFSSHESSISARFRQAIASTIASRNGAFGGDAAV